MNIQETAQLLGLIKLGDNRVVEPAHIQAWHDLVKDLPLEDALEAVREHRRTSTDYLMPAHVVAGVRVIRGVRLHAHPDPLPDVDPDDVAAYQRRRRELRAALASPSSRKELMP